MTSSKSSTGWIEEQVKDSIKYAYAFDQCLFKGTSEFQTVDVVHTKAYGRMLLLDELIMLTETDEFVYHEMISHVPVCFHKNPKHVVVIGGGDGGTARELLRHSSIESIVVCEIDGLVVDVCREFFPEMTASFNHPKVSLMIGDGIEYIKTLKESADLILIDSSDPVGPGEGLFTSEFYQNAAKALKPGGLIAAQSESPWDDAVFLKKIYSKMQSAFPYVYPYMAPIATYPRGLWSWTMASKEAICESHFNEERFDKIAENLQYLTKLKAKHIFDISPFYKKKLV